jgi:predicted NAD/FAD-dependent oxidoreductase
MASIAIVGAGLAGLHVARQLGQEHDVTVVEKSRGPGGRMATRRAGDWHFDHGAQFFTAHTQAFRTFLEPLVSEGVVAHWPARFAEITGTQISAERLWTEDYPHYVGVPGMNAVGKHLAVGVDIRCGTRVDELDRRASQWTLAIDGGAAIEGFDWVVITAPAAQTAGLLPAHSPLGEVASAAVMKSCFALMLGFDDDPGLTFDAALVRGRDISWISVNSSKPGRNGGTTLVVHATNAWADANLERPLAEVSEHMLREVNLATGIDPTRASHTDVQRWRFANIDKQESGATQIDAESGLAVCGDWLIRGRVESAFLSADHLLTGLEPHLGAITGRAGR